MKYKYRIGVIVAQSINAGCNCGAEKKAIDEFCKYFGVSKDYVLETVTNNYLDPKIEELKNENKNLEVFVIRKFICKERKIITSVLLSETSKINTEELVECNQNDIDNAMKNKENVIIYSFNFGNGEKLYKKK